MAAPIFNARTRYPGSHLRAGMPWGREWTPFVFDEAAEKCSNGSPRVINKAGMAALRGDARIEVKEVQPVSVPVEIPSASKQPEPEKAPEASPPAQPKKDAGRR